MKNSKEQLEIKIKQLSEQEALLKTQLAQVCLELRGAKNEKFLLDNNLEIGDKILVGARKVAGILTGFSSTSPIVTWLKKDGTIGQRTSKLYSWDIPTIEKVETNQPTGANEQP